MPLSAVSANLGCASPSRVLAAREVAAVEWAERVRRFEEPHLVFAQEVPNDQWLDAWRAEGWKVSEPEGPSYRVRSALLWRDLEDLGPLDLPTADYHRSYVAGRKLAIRGLEREVAVLSVHAEPVPVSDADKSTWVGPASVRPATSPGQGVLPIARDARAGRSEGTLWDSDMVVATCRLLADDYEVLAVGDLNECLAWDDSHSGHWGAMFHERVRAGDVLELPFHREWSGEQRTYFAPGGASFQLDHALATPAVARLVRSAAVDDTWTEDAVALGAISDHAPIRFQVG